MMLYGASFGSEDDEEGEEEEEAEEETDVVQQESSPEAVAELKRLATAEKTQSRRGIAGASRFCRECQQPVGGKAYCCGDNKDNVMHGECYAKYMLRESKNEEEARQQGEKALKRASRAKYGIGWKVENIPRNIGPAKKLDCCVLPQGMCCLVLNDETDSLDVASTFDAAASVNLEYLSIALQVRQKEGREPFFSLDPVDPTA